MDVNLAFGLILAAISIIIVLPRFKVHIAIAIMIGALFLIFSLGANYHDVINSILQWGSFWRIIAIVSLSLMIVALMEKIGYLNMMVEAVKELAPSAVSSMVSISAFIGLLPMPGGAYVSARLVDPLAKDMSLNPEEATSLNYWFRHLWEYWWPLYTGVIVASEIFQVSIPDFVEHMFFLTILAIIAGYLFIYRPVMKKKNLPREKKRENSGKNMKVLLFSAWPILAVMIATLGFHIDLFFSLLVVDIALLGILIYRKNWTDVRYSLKFAAKPTFLGVTFAAMFMKIAVLQTNSMYYTYGFFTMHHIPAFVVIMLLPYLAGLMTGVTVAYVAATFPLLLPFIGSPVDFTAVALAYASGYSGHLTSPVHLCLVLSAKHYKANLYRVILRVIPSVIFVLGTVLVIYFLF